MRVVVALLFVVAVVAMARPAFAAPPNRPTPGACDPHDPLCTSSPPPQTHVAPQIQPQVAPDRADPPRSVPPEPFILFGTFLVFVIGTVVFFVFVPLVVHIWAIVDVSNARDEVFGPPWDNSKQAWLTGLAVAFMIPFGHLVAPILWWTQVRGPRKRGAPVGRPFWMTGPPVVGPPGAYGRPPPNGPGGPPWS